MELSDVAGRLYGLTPAEFTAARNDAAAAAKASGDGKSAAAIKSLRKPSTSAWLVNLLARDAAGELAELLQLGVRLRAARDAMAGSELSRLSRERHRLVHDLVGVAGRLAAEHGHRVLDTVAREVSATLDAAAVDEGAAAGARSGRLTRALVSSGFEPVDLSGAVAVPEALPEVATASGRPRLRAVKAAPSGKTGQASAAQQAVDAARERAAVAERALVRADAAVESADADVESARRQLQQAEQALREATADMTAARTGRAGAVRDRAVAVRKRDAAQAALQRAETALDARQ